MDIISWLFGLLGQYFEAILVMLVVVSGLITLIDKYCFAKRRVALATIIANEVSHDNSTSKEEASALKEKFMLPPTIADYARSLFWVFFIVILLRSFVAEPFKIPSGSMLPTLKIGDFVLVNKFIYGVRLPLWHTRIMAIGHPKRGDVVVFRFPADPHIDFIKRLIGVPGDKISYNHKTLYINGKKIPKTYLKNVLEPSVSTTNTVKLWSENLVPVRHNIYTSPGQNLHNFNGITVPKGKYFVMGDNRDNSEDSRYWGFVPEQNFVGKAFIVWFSWDSSHHTILPVRWSRIATFIR